ncbi:hypothetical protein L486_05256 [Kwoniella mangroviensis CBS 10435]|uniref:AAA+ ATPase domain-containing protein n=1 Tax=Kwoniella mangroviensis CBS 10435 TaxID=1331196 RepID=A0A1B9IQJ7_9TREE|nr:hypothetical protein L486_05256 [Kwoniella mangroviensis CBS 10435]
MSKIKISRPKTSISLGRLQGEARRYFGSNPILLEAGKVVLAAVMVEVTRRVTSSINNAINQGLILRATIPSSDPAYDWLIHFIRQHTSALSKSTKDSIPFWTDYLEAMYPTGRYPPKEMIIRSKLPTNAPLKTEEHGDPNDPSRAKDEVELFTLPTKTINMDIPFEGHTFHFVLETNSGQKERNLKISVSSFSRSREIFHSLIYHSRTLYLAKSHSRLSIYIPRLTTHWWVGSWNLTSFKPIRPWESVFLPQSVKDGVLRDTREFLENKQFYQDRGLPWRRGWLLYGLPGTGKTSLITALASHFKLGVYIVNVGAKGLDDEVLMKLVMDCPKKCILLFEDISLDTALIKLAAQDPDDRGDTDSKDVLPPIQTRKPVNGNTTSSDVPTSSDELTSDANKPQDASSTNPEIAPTKEESNRSSVTLSGLLNAIDGLAASEGRILFCTTNHVRRIDPALSRPGRCDVWLEFTYATTDQAHELFKFFYQPDSAEALPSPNAVTLGNTMENLDGLLDTSFEKNVFTDNGTEKNVQENLEDIDKSAKEFASLFPKDRLTISSLQSYLMHFKNQPEKAIGYFTTWVEEGCKYTFIQED